jgi:hypothetical protein
MPKPREGYLLIDHSNSPGVPPDMVRAAGFPAPAVGPGQRYESPTFTCAHCNRPVIMNPQRSRPRGYCRKCNADVCDSPSCNAECNPFMQRMERDLEEAFRIENKSTRGGIILP